MKSATHFQMVQKNIEQYKIEQYDICQYYIIFNLWQQQLHDLT